MEVESTQKIQITEMALKKILFHSLLFTSEISTPRMVMGILGGVVDQDIVNVYQVLCVAVGTAKSVGTEPRHFNQTQHFNNKIEEMEMSASGWYVSLPLITQNFFNDTNRKNHLGCQSKYQKAIASADF